MKLIMLLATSAVLFLQSGFVSSAQAQTYSVDWFTIDGGGGTSAGGGYQISGTIGQSDASTPMTNGIYSIVGGFWSGAVIIQTPGGPVLRISLTRTNAIVLSWPSASTGFTLQQNTTFATTNWSAVGLTVSDDGTTKSVVVPSPVGNMFYRLKE